MHSQRFATILILPPVVCKQEIVRIQPSLFFKDVTTIAGVVLFVVVVANFMESLK